MSMNDGGFIVEIASLIFLIMMGAVIVSIGYGIIKFSTWLYRKTHKAREIKNDKT